MVFASCESGAEGQPKSGDYKSLAADEKAEWAAFSKVNQLVADSSGLFPKAQNYFYKFIDTPVTWFHDSIVEPMRDKFGHWPYYQRRFARVPTIDECQVGDTTCWYEANMQYKLDMQVDAEILSILKMRKYDCFDYYGPNQTWKCSEAVEAYEENELNYFIKYGELGGFSNCVTAYMKQKHRLIWERRHPEVLEERAKQVEEHKKQLAEGNFNFSFWKTGSYWQDVGSQPRFQENREWMPVEGVDPADLEQTRLKNYSDHRRPQPLTFLGKWFKRSETG